MAKRVFRATAFIKFSVDETKMKELGLDIEMPPAGFLHDDIMTLLDGEEGVSAVESVVIKECTPLPTHLEVKSVLCAGCNQLKSSFVQGANGKVCVDCFGTVIPIRQLPSKK